MVQWTGCAQEKSIPTPAKPKGVGKLKFSKNDCKCNKPSARATSDQTLRQALRFTGTLAGLLFLFALSCRPSFGQSGIYGPGINSDALNNIRIGPYGLQASYRFMATHTGTVSSFHFYLITHASKPGYNAGTGGNLLVRLETDDGTEYHRPSGNSLGSYTIIHPSQTFPTITLYPMPYLEQGRLYHLVFTNTDGSPSTNYVSVDDLYMYHPLSQMQPLYSNANCATLIRDTTENWYQDSVNTPIFQVSFSDGTTMGVGYMEVWPEVPEVIGGTNAVRETFTVSGGTRTVVSFAVRVARTNGAGGLYVRLENASGTLIEEGQIPASSIPLSSTTSPNYVWVTYKFSAVRTLYSGDSYHVDLEGSVGSTFQVFPIRKGVAYNFAKTTYFPDGYAQFKSGSGWVGWTQWGVTNRTDADLQFYFIQ